MSLYPLLFEPNLHKIIWGGTRLCPFKGLEPIEEPIGESWEVSCIPESTNIIANGEYAGMDLASLIERFPEEILGKTVNKEYKGQFPLLVKFIDAQQDLSILVHPDDEMAQREHGKRGKSEMWYIMDATPGSYIYVGFKKQVTPEEYKQHIEDGTITSILAKHEVHPGDAFYIPAGRVHAIGAGILLAEVQQSSDVTYRIYDYERLGLEGKPRELHTELAAQALNFHVEKKYRSSYHDRINKANRVINSPYFTVCTTALNKPVHRRMLRYESFVISMCIEGSYEICNRITKECVTLSQGNSCLIPAAIADYDIIPKTESARTIETFINNKSHGIAAKFSRFIHFLMRK